MGYLISVCTSVQGMVKCVYERARWWDGAREMEIERER